MSRVLAVLYIEVLSDCLTCVYRCLVLTVDNRLMLGLSLCDIITSCTFGLASFLYPQETSRRPWLFGTKTSCSIVGFLNQFSYSGVLYNAMLSYYFLLVTRYQMKNNRIAKRIEPAMHLLCIFFPLTTASVGLLMDIYGERPAVRTIRAGVGEVRIITRSCLLTGDPSFTSFVHRTWGAGSNHVPSTRMGRKRTASRWLLGWSSEVQCSCSPSFR